MSPWIAVSDAEYFRLVTTDVIERLIELSAVPAEEADALRLSGDQLAVDVTEIFEKHFPKRG